MRIEMVYLVCEFERYVGNVSIKNVNLGGCMGWM